MLNADQLIRALSLKPHPEGGFYAETFRAPLTVESAEHAGTRRASTAIYFLLRRGDFSAFHRVRSDEVWHHYAGDALELFALDDAGLCTRRVGLDLSRGERPQWVVPRNVLQAARVAEGGSHGFALCGCTVAPGFEFADFTMPGRAELSARYPAHAALFEALCRA